MPQIEPFKGILYNPKKVNISKVVAPPYDVISPAMQDELYRADKHNIIRLILGKEEPLDSDINNKYKRAAAFFNKWIGEGVLSQDERPAVYVYLQEYSHGEEKKKSIGFVTRIKLEDQEKSKVLPHEKTFAKPKQDRLNLVREVKANLSPIFTLFQDDKNSVTAILKKAVSKRPVFDFSYDGVRHKFWRLDDERLIKDIKKLMRHKDIFIADGHHRYAVSAMYREEMRTKTQNSKVKTSAVGGSTSGGQNLSEGYDYGMMYFAPISEKALTILATHRMIKGIDIDIEEAVSKLGEYFNVETLDSAAALLKRMAMAKRGEKLFGMYPRDKKFYLLKLKKGVNLDKLIKEDRTPAWKRLDVSILQGLILDHILGLKSHVEIEGNVVYTRDPMEAVSEVDNGSCSIVFLLNPTKISEVKEIAKLGDKMPHKSTYFYPKLLSGLVINKLT